MPHPTRRSESRRIPAWSGSSTNHPACAWRAKHRHDSRVIGLPFAWVPRLESNQISRTTRRHIRSGCFSDLHGRRRPASEPSSMGSRLKPSCGMWRQDPCRTRGNCHAKPDSLLRSNRFPNPLRYLATVGSGAPIDQNSAWNTQRKNSAMPGDVAKERSNHRSRFAGYPGLLRGRSTVNGSAPLARNSPHSERCT